MQDAAPSLYLDAASSVPSAGQAFWLKTRDGVRLRTAYWPDGARGTALIFQGRTEFIEKFEDVIARFRARGFAAAAFDWRGQGLSDRALPDRRKGYIGSFLEYQRDVDAVMDALITRGAPAPWLLVGHSMGGAIAARTLMRQDNRRTPPEGGNPLESRFAAAILSAPMLGLQGDADWVVAKAASRILSALGLGRAYATGGAPETIWDRGFADNPLTTDEAAFNRFAQLTTAHPDLALGGVTWSWLRAAYREMPELRPTRIPTLLAIGENETVVSIADARTYADGSDAVRLVALPGARHEPFIETEDVRFRLWNEIDAFLADSGF